MDSPVKTLLLVDDEMIIAMAHAKLLEKEGYNVILAQSGQEAIDMVCAGGHKIDLILMDVDLGKGMDGTDAAQEILKVHDLPILFHSSHTERDVVEKTEKITSYGYVVKDSGITVLSASIKMAFKLHAAHRELAIKEEALRESESKFRLFFNQAPVGAAISSTDYCFISVNEEMCHMLGYSEDELTSLSFIDITHPDYLNTDVAQVQRLRAGEIDHYSTDKRYIRKDGTVFWGHLSLRAIRDPKGELLNYLPMLWDISDRKRIEMALLETEAKTGSIINNLPLGIHQYRLESDGKLVFEGANQAADRILRVDHKQYVGMSIEEAFPNLIGTEVPQRYRQACIEGTPWHLDRVMYEDNKVKGAFEVHAFQTEPGRMAALFSEITDRKKAEERMRILSELIDAAPVSITVHDFDGNFLYANETTFAMHGYSKEEFFSINLRNLDVPESSRLIESRMNKLRETGELSFEANHFRKDRSILPLNVHSKITQWEEKKVLLSIAMDITERKRAGEAIRESETRYRRITDAITDYIYTVRVEDGKATETRHGPGCLAVTGYSEEEFFKDPYLWFRIVAAEDRTAVEEHARRVLADMEMPAIEHRVVRKDGVERWVRNTPVPRHDASGRLQSYDGLIQDVTDRKTLEEVMRERQEIFRLFLKNSPVYVFFKDENIRATRLSDNYEKLLGRPMHELIGKTMYDLFPTEFARNMVEDDRKVLFGNRQVDIIEEFSGRIYSTTKFPIPRPGKPPHLAGFTIDITEQKAAERALKESEEKYRRLFENASMGVFHSLPEGRFLIVNPSLARMMGYDSPEEMVRIVTDISTQIYIDPQDRVALMADMLKTDGWIYAQNNFRRKDGSLMTGNLSLRKELNPDGSIAYLEGFIEDITERNQADEARTQSDALFRSMVESSPLAIIVSMGPEGIFEYINPKFKEIFGYTLDDVHSANEWWKRAYPDESYRKEAVSKWLQRIRMYSVRQEFEPLETTVTCKDGSKRIIELKLASTGDKYITFGTDLTQRKRAEEALAELVSEKELWLKELQHRVKNNLNVISSLLGLEMEKLKDERSRRIFTNAQYRIRSMSAIYEQLYQTADIDRVDLDRYIKDLAESLYVSYAIDSHNVKLKTNIEKLKLDLKRAVPLGLMLNELIMNALKYAYPAKKKGEIRIDLHKSDDMLSLCVSDDGVGLPAGLDPAKTESMGLNLVRMLARQIDGELSIESRGGVTILVSFNL